MKKRKVNFYQHGFGELSKRYIFGNYLEKKFRLAQLRIKTFKILMRKSGK